MGTVSTKVISRTLFQLFFFVWALLGQLNAPAYADLTSLPEDNATYRRVREVYLSIAQAFGEGRQPPRLVVTPKGALMGNIVAWSNAGSEVGIGVESSDNTLSEGFIAIEERTVELLDNFGPDRFDALAFLLGHELTHYYMRHGWVGDFGNAFAEKDMGRKMIKAAAYEDIIKRETEADYFGGFYSFLAGYDSLRVAPRVLDTLYATYQLPEKLPNYPSRAERKAISERALANLGKMTPLFDAGTRLVILGRYEEAGRLFNYLAQNFPSREIYNDAGIAYALEAMRLFRPGAVRFQYPFELDADTRLRGRAAQTRALFDPNAPKRNQLLRKALENFEMASQRDRRYPTSLVNAAAIQSLLGDQDTAILTARSALNLARQQNERQTAAHAQIVSGIAWALSSETEKARKDFAAVSDSSDLAGKNLAILQGEVPQAPSGPPEAKDADPSHQENISGITPCEKFVIDEWFSSVTLNPSEKEQQKICIHTKRGQNNEVTVISLEGRLIKMVATAKKYPGSTRQGIRIGSSRAEVVAKYGSTDRVLLSRQGEYLVFPSLGLVVAVDANKVVTGWLLYASSRN